MFRLINNIGIQQRLLLLAILPVMITTLILGSYITTSRIDDINTSLMERGKSLAKHIAPSLEFGLFAGDTLSLQKITRHWLGEPDVVAISVINTKGVSVVSVSKPLEVALEPGDILFFSEPIIRSFIEQSESEFDLLGNAEKSRKTEVLGEVRVEISNLSTRERERTVLVNSALIMISGLLVSAILAMRIGGTVANPIIHLTRAVKLLRTGNFDVRVHTDSGGELETLEKGFNDMAATLQESQVDLHAQVQRATGELREIVRELEKKNEELDVARKQAIKSGQARLEFLAKMSHEIRTPVNAVIGFAKLLNKSRSQSEEEQYKHTIIQASNQLLSIIDDILNFSKIEYGTISLENIPFNIREVVEDVVIMHRPSAYSKNLELVLNIHSDVPYNVFGDSTRISQVLMNLLSNAIKFTEQGQIVVQVEQVDYNELVQTKFSISDTGIGIGKLEGEKLFKAFSQVDTSITRRFGGTGLGLVIAKRIIELMGGEVGFQSEKGKGSTFWFMVPFHVQQKQEEAKLYPEFLDKQIAIIESNTHMRRSLRNAFISQGAKVFAFEDFEKLLGSLNTVKPDCLLFGLTADTTAAEPLRQLMGRIRVVYGGPVLFQVAQEDYTLPMPLNSDDSIRLLTKPARSSVLYSIIIDLMYKRGRTHDSVKRASSEVESVIPSYQGSTILVAEDNNFNKTLINNLLVQRGLKVLEASTGREAIEQYLQNDIELILMDIHMPEMDGLEATNQIRAIESNVKHTPIIALTADVFIKERQNLRAAGLDDYLLKPLSEDALDTILVNWIKNPSTEKQHAKPESEQTTVIQEKKVYIPPDLYGRLNDDIDKTIEELHTGFEKNDSNSTYEAAHKLLGTIGYFEIKELMTIARKLDKESKLGDLSSARESFESLKKSLAVFREKNKN